MKMLIVTTTIEFYISTLDFVLNYLFSNNFISCTEFKGKYNKLYTNYIQIIHKQQNFNTSINWYYCGEMIYF